MMKTQRKRVSSMMNGMIDGMKNRVKKKSKWEDRRDESGVGR